MSGKRPDFQDPSRCRFSFADGRRCRMPARLELHGLCFHHGTFRSRASRQDNFLREMACLTRGSAKPADYSRAERTLFRAFYEGRISAQEFGAFKQLSSLIRLTDRVANEEQFSAGCGPAWDAIRKLIDREDSADSERANPSFRRESVK